MDRLEYLLNNNIRENVDNLLEVVPEVAIMFDFCQKHPHHHLDLWNHTLLTLDIAQMEGFNDYAVKLALLLHDIGKPYSFVEGDVRHYPNHALCSYEIAKNILSRFNYTEEFKIKVLFLIKNHDNKIEKEILNLDKELIMNLYQVQYCDALAHNPKYLDKRCEYLDKTLKLIKK